MMAAYRISITSGGVDTTCKVSGSNRSRMNKTQLREEAEQNRKANQNEETEQEHTGDKSSKEGSS